MRIPGMILALVLTAQPLLGGGGVKGGGTKGGDDGGASGGRAVMQYDLKNSRFNPTIRVGEVRSSGDGQYLVFRSSGTDRQGVFYQLIYYLESSSFKNWVTDVEAHNNSGRKLPVTVQVYRQQGGISDDGTRARYRYWCRVIHVQVPPRQSSVQPVSRFADLQIRPRDIQLRDGKVYYRPGRGRRSARYYTYVFEASNYRQFIPDGTDGPFSVRIRISSQQQSIHQEMAGTITTVIYYAEIVNRM